MLNRLFLAVVLLSCAPAFALPTLSDECRNLSAHIVTKFWGNGLTHATGRYKLHLDFDKGEAVSASTNWGFDKAISFDPQNFSMNAKVSIFGTATISCILSNSNGNCGDGVTQLLTMLNQAKNRYSNITGSDAEKTSDKKAIDCAIERTNFFASKVNEEIKRTLTIRPLQGN